MKNAKTFMLSAVAALCMTTGNAYAEGNDYSQKYVQQREYRMPIADDMRHSNQYDSQRHQYRNDTNASADVKLRGTMDHRDKNIRWTGAPSHRASLTTAQLQQVQQSLSAAGHDVSVDGIWGPETASAVKDFQRQKNLDVTGALNRETLSALDVSNVTQNNR